jgi:hypothetical protein
MNKQDERNVAPRDKPLLATRAVATRQNKKRSSLWMSSRMQNER